MKYLMFRLLFCLFLGLFASPLMAVDCTPDDITLSSQSDVDNFQANHGPGCDTVVGRLTVSGSDVSNLDGLSGLKNVGQLGIAGAELLNNLNGLHNLEGFGSLVISSNPLLETVSALAGVSGPVWRMIVIDNPSLQHLDGLNGISSASNWILVQGNESLANLDGLRLSTEAGKIQIEDNAALSSLSSNAFSNLTEHSGFIEIKNNPMLETIDGFSNLTSAGVISISSNPALLGLGGLGNLNTASDLVIDGNDMLVNLGGLGSLAEVTGDFTIRNNANLENPGALNNLTDVGELLISNNAALTSLSGLSSLANVSRFTIYACESLTDLVGLGNVAVGDELYISNNASLQSLAGLEYLAGDQDFGITLESNPALADLSALSSLTGLGSMQFVNNSLITSLDFLSSLDHVDGGLRISNISGLLDLTGLENLSSVGGTLLISNNANLDDLSGLSGLTTAWDFKISDNDSLLSLDGVMNLDSVGYGLVITNNNSLVAVDGLESLAFIGDYLYVGYNPNLANLDGLGSLISVGDYASISDNPQLDQCSGLIPLIDEIDDGAPGPGPGVAGIPDIGNNLSLQGNNASCNSREAILDGQLPQVSAEFHVNLDHSDENNKSETIGLNCIGVASVTTISDVADYNTTAQFEVAWNGIDSRPSCTASITSENAGYTADESDCQDVVLEDESTQTCTIVNNQDPAFVVVEKSFTDGNAMGVAVELSCSSGTVIVIDGTASVADPARFEVRDFRSGGSTCRATEFPVPGGYRQQSSSCGFISVNQGEESSCAFVNEPESLTESIMFEVSLNFSDDNPAAAEIGLSCENVLSISASPLTAAMGSPAVFTVDREPGQTGSVCTASQLNDLSGYSLDETNCSGVSLDAPDPACVIHNLQDPVNITVGKRFADDNPVDVTINLSCPNGEVKVDYPTASIANDASFTVSNFPFNGASCSASEVMPVGYKQESSTCDSLAVAPGAGDSCTIYNAPKTPEDPDPTAITGSWYDPETSGEGLMIHAVNEELAVIYFYGFDEDGDRLWLVGTSSGLFAYGVPVLIEAQYVSGGSFTKFDADNIVRSDWGGMQFTQWDCETATVEMSGLNGEKTLHAVRAAPTSGSLCSGAESTVETDAVTGSWYEQLTSGQGFAVHKVNDHLGVVYFYGYNDAGGNLWLIGTWEDQLQFGEDLTIEMLQVTGGTFGPFDPDDVIRETWGALTLRFDSCSSGWAKLDGMDGIQELDLSLLAGSFGLDCPPDKAKAD